MEGMRFDLVPVRIQILHCSYSRFRNHSQKEASWFNLVFKFHKCLQLFLLIGSLPGVHWASTWGAGIQELCCSDWLLSWEPFKVLRSWHGMSIVWAIAFDFQVFDCDPGYSSNRSRLISGFGRITECLVPPTDLPWFYRVNSSSSDWLPLGCLIVTRSSTSDWSTLYCY